MAVGDDRRLRDLGLKSERLLWPTKGPGKFESGVSQGVPKQQRFTVSFYLTAMLFILFGIEIVFLYPLAVILHELAWFGFFEFLVFLVILFVAYVYIWRKGALEWR